jgi:hypothetical protein
MNIDVTNKMVDHSICSTTTENAPSPVAQRTIPATPIPRSAVAVLFTFSDEIAMYVTTNTIIISSAAKSHHF